MKKEVSPVVAIVVIVLVLVVIAGAYYWRTSSRPASEGGQPPPMPPEVGKTLSEIMSRAGQQQGQSAPVQQQNRGPQLGPGGVPAPPPPR